MLCKDKKSMPADQHKLPDSIEPWHLNTSSKILQLRQDCSPTCGVGKSSASRLTCMIVCKVVMVMDLATLFDAAATILPED